MPTLSRFPGTLFAPVTRPAVRRRDLLGAALGTAGLALVAGCTGTPPPRPRPSPTPTGPDPQLADLENEQALLAAYDATLRAHPKLADRLRPVRADHAAHAAALRRLLTPAGGRRRTSASPTPPAPTVSPVPADPAAALAALRTAEQSAYAARTRACLAAATDRAALLGSIAASEASHGVLLGSPGGTTS